MAEPPPLPAINRVVDDESVAAVYVATRRYPDDLVVVTVDGEIDLSNISRFEKKLVGHEKEPWLVLDMSGVRFCGVVGARLLHTMAVRSSIVGRRFEIVDSRAIARVLEATGLAEGITRRTSPPAPTGARRHAVAGPAHSNRGPR